MYQKYRSSSGPRAAVLALHKYARENHHAILEVPRKQPRALLLLQRGRLRAACRALPTTARPRAENPHTALFFSLLSHLEKPGTLTHRAQPLSRHAHKGAAQQQPTLTPERARAPSSGRSSLSIKRRGDQDHQHYVPRRAALWCLENSSTHGGSATPYTFRFSFSTPSRAASVGPDPALRLVVRDAVPVRKSVGS